MIYTKPIERAKYLWGCVVCKKRIISSSTVVRHCGKLTQWEKTLKEEKRMEQQKTYSIVEYARLIGKNTAEFTTKDMQGYMKWLTKQPSGAQEAKSKPSGNVINIPFMGRWKQAMLNGIKVMTARTKQYGKVGDRFNAFGATFQLVKVSQVTLEHIAKNYYRQEGVDSPKEFKKVWNEIHHITGYVPDKLVWLHEFKRVAAD